MERHDNPRRVMMRLMMMMMMMMHNQQYDIIITNDADSTIDMRLFQFAHILSMHQKTVVTFLMFASRNNKHVIIDGGFIVPYDHLILCTGRQYQVPKPTGLDVNAGATNNDLDSPDRPQPRLLDSVPKNVFVVNDAYEAAVVLYWLEDNVVNATGVCSLAHWLAVLAAEAQVGGLVTSVRLLSGTFVSAVVSLSSVSCNVFQSDRITTIGYYNHLKV